MSLVTIAEGSEVVSSTLNTNFEYLDERIDTVGTGITTLQSNISSLSSTLSGQINTAMSTLNSSIGGVLSTYVNGLFIAKVSDNTISVSAGSRYNSTGTTILTLATATSKKNDSQAANATYYVYIISNGSTTTVLISTSSSSPLLPSGYTLYGFIGRYTTDSSGKIEYIYSGCTLAPTPTATLISSYIHNTSWYRVYSDGWCEQGGHITETTSATVSFLKPFTDIMYAIQITCVNKAPSDQNWTCSIKSNASFTYRNSEAFQADWVAYGYTYLR